MDTPTTILEEALEAWTWAREGFLAELDGIPESRWDERPHPHARSVAELAKHVLESGLMMVGELTDPNGDFRRSSPQEIMASHAGEVPESAAPAEWKALLRGQLESGVRAFRDVGEVAVLQEIRRFDGLMGTRLAWMHHGVAHEEYHRGQVALLARTMGLIPALTRMIYGDAAV
jgi:uncharacterized damage-inducible protein DinB